MDQQFDKQKQLNEQQAQLKRMETERKRMEEQLKERELRMKQNQERMRKQEVSCPAFSISLLKESMFLYIFYLIHIVEAYTRYSQICLFIQEEEKKLKERMREM